MNDRKSPSDTSIDDRLDKLGKSLEVLNEKIEILISKTGKKWELPVFMAVFTMILGIINYTIERNVDKHLSGDLKKKEIYAEFIAESKRDFYKNAKVKLLELRLSFERFCIFGDQNAENTLDENLRAYMLFYEKQQVIDEKIVSSMRRYSEYISESVFNLTDSDANSSATDSLLKESLSYYDNALNSITKGLKALEK